MPAGCERRTDWKSTYSEVMIELKRASFRNSRRARGKMRE